MANAYTAITKKRGKGWIGWIEEVPGVNCQERTREESLRGLRTTLREALAAMRRHGVGVLDVPPRALTPEPINRYLLIKSTRRL